MNMEFLMMVMVVRGDIAVCVLETFLLRRSLSLNDGRVEKGSRDFATWLRLDNTGWLVEL